MKILISTSRGGSTLPFEIRGNDGTHFTGFGVSGGQTARGDHIILASYMIAVRSKKRTNFVTIIASGAGIVLAFNMPNQSLSDGELRVRQRDAALYARKASVFGNNPEPERSWDVPSRAARTRIETDLIGSIALAYGPPAVSSAAIEIDPKRAPYSPMPKILYHGTANPRFENFDNQKRGTHDTGWLGFGFYFFNNWAPANSYSLIRRRKSQGTARVISAKPKSGLKLYPLTADEYMKCKHATRNRDTAAQKHSEDLSEFLRQNGFDGACYMHPTAERNLEMALLDRGSFHIEDHNAEAPGAKPADGVSVSAASRKTAWILVYHPSSNKYLMLKRSKTANNPNLWNFPGGGTDGDSAELGAKRELMEEAGIKCRKSALLKIAKIKAFDATYFLLVVDELPVLKVDPKESSKYRWMTLKEIRAIDPKKLHHKTAGLLTIPKLKTMLADITRAELTRRVTA